MCVARSAGGFRPHGKPRHRHPDEALKAKAAAADNKHHVPEQSWEPVTVTRQTEMSAVDQLAQIPTRRFYGQQGAINQRSKASREAGSAVPANSMKSNIQPFA